MEGGILDIIENRAQALGKLRVHDEDANDSHVLIVLKNHDFFDISSDNQLVIKSPGLDYETHQTMYVQIMATDTGEPSMSCTKTFNFTILDTNEAPTNIKLTNLEVCFDILTVLNYLI